MEGNTFIMTYFVHYKNIVANINGMAKTKKPIDIDTPLYTPPI